MIASPLHTTDAGAESGTVVTLVPKDRLNDFSRLCAALIWSTFKGDSMKAKAHAASQWARWHSLPNASQRTFQRILTGETSAPDTRLMFHVLAEYQRRHGHGFGVGDGMEIQIVRRT